MVPRADMVFVERDKTIRQVLSLALRSGFSRIPVVDEGDDDVVGIAYMKDMVARSYENPDAIGAERVEGVWRPARQGPGKVERCPVCPAGAGPDAASRAPGRRSPPVRLPPSMIVVDRLQLSPPINHDHGNIGYGSGRKPNWVGPETGQLAQPAGTVARAACGTGHKGRIR